MPKPDDPRPASGLAQQLDELDALLPELLGKNPTVSREEASPEAPLRAGIPVLDRPVTPDELDNQPSLETAAAGYSPQVVAALLDKMELRFINELDKMITDLKDRLGIETPRKIQREDPETDTDGDW
jgi:hypothetical protein